MASFNAIQTKTVSRGDDSIHLTIAFRQHFVNYRDRTIVSDKGVKFVERAAQFGNDFSLCKIRNHAILASIFLPKKKGTRRLQR